MSRNCKTSRTRTGRCTDAPGSPAGVESDIAFGEKCLTGRERQKRERRIGQVSSKTGRIRPEGFGPESVRVRVADATAESRRFYAISKILKTPKSKPSHSPPRDILGSRY